jgi:ribosome-binding factor A
MPLGGRDETAVMGALARAKGFLRRQIAHSVHLKFVPDLTFRIDPSFEQADRIARVLREPEVARDLHTDAPRNEDKEGEV